jgi:para-aminobenzoate synthetase component 1
VIAPALSRLLPAWVDPELVFLRLFGTAQRAFWLDAGPGAEQGRSFMGAASEVSDALDAEPFATDDALGWFGWLDYESGARAMGVPTATTDRGIRLLRGARVIEFDHTLRRIRLVAVAEHGAPEWLEHTARAIASIRGSAPDPRAPAPSRAVWRHDAAHYAELVRRCQAHIRAGDAYQLCLTNEVTVAGRFDPIERYRALRRLSPSHHGGLIRCDGTALLSSSPERFLELRDGRVVTHPIKGTRPRAADTATDAALRAALLASEKERAENLMIVDLMRNDLSRVAELGTVHAEKLLEVESYPQVHQLVSSVSARLRPEVGFAELIAATFPAGSMTGAPKRRAMQILAELEQGPRGVYAGAFGRFGADGSLDAAMVIRSIVLDAHGARIGTGGGITILSDPDEEVEETRVKARALLTVLGAEPAA